MGALFPVSSIVIPTSVALTPRLTFMVVVPRRRTGPISHYRAMKAYLAGRYPDCNFQFTEDEDFQTEDMFGLIQCMGKIGNGIHQEPLHFASEDLMMAISDELGSFDPVSWLSRH